jgi:hypothetical protein
VAVPDGFDLKAAQIIGRGPQVGQDDAQLLPHPSTHGTGVFVLNTGIAGRGTGGSRYFNPRANRLSEKA